MDKTKINLERLRAYDAEWEESKHPRAKNGQFTSGSGSAGGVEEYMPTGSAEPKSPLRQAAEAIKGGSATEADDYKSRMSLIKNEEEKKEFENARNLMDEYTSAVYPPIREAYWNYILRGDPKDLRKVTNYFEEEGL